MFPSERTTILSDIPINSSISEEIILDEDGNPISKPIKDENEKQKDSSDKSHENHTPTEKVIHLDNL